MCEVEVELQRKTSLSSSQNIVVGVPAWCGESFISNKQSKRTNFEPNMFLIPTPEELVWIDPNCQQEFADLLNIECFGCKRMNEGEMVTITQHIGQNTPYKARLGQEYWRSEYNRMLALWEKMEIPTKHPLFKDQMDNMEIAAVKSQKKCVLLKMQIGVVNGIIKAKIDRESNKWQGFVVVPHRAKEFRTWFDPGLTPKSFCSVWRRAGFVPENRMWDQAIKGLVAFVFHPLPD